MTPAGPFPAVVGSVLTIGAAPEPFLVASCRDTEIQGRVCLRLIAISGHVIEKEVEVTQLPVVPQDKANRATFFLQRRFCPLCHASVSEAERLFPVRQLFWDLDVVACRGCGMAFKDALPQPALLAHIYAPTYVHFGRAREDAWRVQQSRVARLGKPHGRHLDYGCGIGALVQAALHAGWDSYGADPYLPDEAHSGALTKRLFQVDARDSAALAQLGKFDCITMWAVVEHLTSFRESLDGLTACLKPGGVMIFNAPNARSLAARGFGRSWRMATLVEHVQFCTPSAVRWIAKRWGLEPCRIRFAGAPFPLGRGGGAGEQGVSALPFRTWCLAADAANDSCVSLNPRGRKRNPMHDLSAFLVKSSANAIGGGILRRMVHASRLGDHIEVTLRSR